MSKQQYHCISFLNIYIKEELVRESWMGEHCILGYFHSWGMELWFESLKTWNVTGVFDGRNHDMSWGLRNRQWQATIQP